MTHILAIDVGTQSVRALLFDLDGKLATKAQIPFEPYHAKKSGWAEQRPEYFWEKLAEACQKLWQTTSIPKSEIAGVALTTQRGTVINVDSEGRPLRPAIVWPDERRTHGLKPVGGMWGVAFKLIRMTETIAYIQAEAEANWIRTHEPEIWQKTHKYLLLSGYLTYRLTNRFVDSVGCQVAYIPFDYKNLAWSGPRDWKWEAIPIRPDILPDLVPPAGMLGEITPQAAEATGIPVGLPVIAAAADKACEVIGSGSLEPHIGCLSFGSNATVNITYKKYIEAIPLIPPYPSAIPGLYSSEIQVPRGYWMVSWFKKEFALLETQLAAERGLDPENLFDELVYSTPPGADGLILQPYWSPGLRIPGPEARGAIIGWTNVHTRAHLYRAILEGIGYALREGKERCEKRSGVPVTELRVIGGGSQSDAALQLTADIFGLPASRIENYEASGLGAAIDAAVGLKLHPDFETALGAMVRQTRTFEPDTNRHKLYDGLYHNVYQPMYDDLRLRYKAIQKAFEQDGG
jgi:sugar (pentulose or hexulose) kinase